MVRSSSGIDAKAPPGASNARRGRCRGGAVEGCGGVVAIAVAVQQGAGRPEQAIALADAYQSAHDRDAMLQPERVRGVAAGGDPARAVTHLVPGEEAQDLAGAGPEARGWPGLVHELARQAATRPVDGSMTRSLAMPRPCQCRSRGPGVLPSVLCHAGRFLSVPGRASAQPVAERGGRPVSQSPS